jgi:Serine dehydrogenase proteinase
MTREERMKLIGAIEEARGSTVIVYIAADRQGLEINIATDVFPILYSHLAKAGYQNQIDLFLYGTSGMPMAGYALVNFFREFCGNFNVIVPFKAHGTATLIALGADELVMSEMGQLSPIDPSVPHPLSPKVTLPNQLIQDVPVNVEDVDGFLSFARNELGLGGEESMQKVLEALSSNVNPLVLGAMYRSREQIAFLAAQLLKQHTDDDELVDRAVSALMSKRLSHEYIISRKEAKENLGLNVIEPDARLSSLILGLWEQYVEITKVDKPYNPEMILEGEYLKVSNFDRGVIESKDLTHVFRTQKEVERSELSMPQGPFPPMEQPGLSLPQGPFPQIAYREQILEESWIEDDQL